MNAAPPAGTTSPTDVEVTVVNTQPTGRVLGRVFADAAAFKALDPAVTQFAIDPQGANRARTVIGLLPGRYAIALFQDVAGTGKLATNLFGVPTVPYGFSNDAKRKLGRPGFDAAAFVVGRSAKSISITLR